MFPPHLRIFFYVYDCLWLLAIPWLRFSKRLSEGFDNRCLRTINFGRVDIWIHAASAGEAYLVRQLITSLKNIEKSKILVTTNTSQGKAILEEPLAECQHEYTVTYIPFDKPSLIKKVVAVADPKLLVLVELEIWPALLAEMKRAGKKILIINGRMTKNSYSSYRKTSFLWSYLKPDVILAISEDDRKRFVTTFHHNNAFYVPNLKFDRMEKCRIEDREKSKSSFLVLASVRKEEEDEVLFLIEELLEKVPDLRIGLFPRHMHRLTAWESLLTDKGVPWVRKSKHQENGEESIVLLWDVFGELGKAYREADAAFVGGSLAPLGGQNFLEAFMNGVTPVTGPHISNFLWTGKEVFEEGLVKLGQTKKEVLELLLETLENQMEKSVLKEKADRYIAAKQGGTKKTCIYIKELLEG